MLFSATDYYFLDPSQLHLAPEATRSRRKKRGVNGGLFLPRCLVMQKECIVITLETRLSQKVRALWSHPMP